MHQAEQPDFMQQNHGCRKARLHNNSVAAPRFRFRVLLYMEIHASFSATKFFNKKIYVGQCFVLVLAVTCLSHL